MLDDIDVVLMMKFKTIMMMMMMMTMMMVMMMMVMMMMMIMMIMMMRMMIMMMVMMMMMLMMMMLMLMMTIVMMKMMGMMNIMKITNFSSFLLRGSSQGIYWQCAAGKTSGFSRVSQPVPTRPRYCNGKTSLAIHLSLLSGTAASLVVTRHTPFSDRCSVKQFEWYPRLYVRISCVHDEQLVGAA